MRTAPPAPRRSPPPGPGTAGDRRRESSAISAARRLSSGRSICAIAAGYGIVGRPARATKRGGGTLTLCAAAPSPPRWRGWCWSRWPATAVTTRAPTRPSRRSMWCRRPRTSHGSPTACCGSACSRRAPARAWSSASPWRSPSCRCRRHQRHGWVRGSAGRTGHRGRRDDGGRGPRRDRVAAGRRCGCRRRADVVDRGDGRAG